MTFVIRGCDQHLPGMLQRILQVEGVASYAISCDATASTEDLVLSAAACLGLAAAMAQLAMCEAGGALHV